MKIIKSASYMRKEAIYSDTPVGDPGLPGQLTERDIVSGPDEDVSSKNGYSELDGYNLYYTYEYDYNDNIANNIKPTKATEDATGNTITDYNLLENLLYDNEELVKNDIEMSEDDSKLERQPGYGQPEYDPVGDLGF